MKAREDGLADRADDLTKLANLSLSKAEALELASYNDLIQTLSFVGRPLPSA
jgi:hypothetical protein